MFTLQRLALPPAYAVREGLIDLLCDSVEGGASVGFLDGRLGATVVFYKQL